MISAYAVLIGLITAIILGIFQSTFISQTAWIYFLLAVLGVIIGLASVGNDYRDSIAFLFATISLVIVSYMGQETLKLVGYTGNLISTTLSGLLAMFIPATIIVAIKTVFSVARVK